MMNRKSIYALFLLVTLLVMTAGIEPASASTTFPGDWATQYPSSQTDDNMISATGAPCQMCHENDNGGNTVNLYGWAIKQRLDAGDTINQALSNVESQDSDGNGDSNLVEINANAQPGWVPGAVNTIYRTNGKVKATDSSPPTGVTPLDPVTGNNPPVANDDSDTVAEGASVDIDVVANDTDADGTVDATTVTIITDVTNGSTAVNPTTGVVTYTHDGSETTSDSFTYTVQDNNGATSNTATVTITVTPVNDPPVANDDADTVAEGGSVPIDVVANDTDADGTVDATTVTIITDVSNGSTVVNPTTGVVTYTHDGSETTSDSFTYTVQDNNWARPATPPR